MKTKYLIIGLLTVLLLAIGFYFYYQHQLRQQTPDVWSFVPESAIVVYESENIWEDWSNIRQQPAWELLSSIPYFQQISDHIVQLDSLTGEEKSLEAFYHAKPFLLSVHVTSKDALDYLFYFPIRGAPQHALVQNVIKTFKEKPQITANKRVYNGYNIFELKDAETDTYFSYIIYKNFFVGSFTPFLVEDVIRNIDPEQDIPDFRTANPDMFYNPQLENDEGNLYVNATKLPLLFSTFAANEKAGDLQRISALCQAMFLDVTLEDQDILLNGFSTAGASENTANQEVSLVKTFSGQMPKKMSMQDYVPEETALLYHFTFDDPLLWQKRLYAYLQQQNGQEPLAFLKTGNVTNSPGVVSAEDIFSWFRGEIGLSIMESVAINNPDLLLLIDATDTTKALRTLQNVHAEVSKQPGDSMYTEQFGGHTLRELSYEEFPAHLLGPLFSGFEHCFFTFSGHYLLMANDVNTLKRVLLGRELENTWSKSVKQSVFLESIIEEANFSMIINTARAWEMLKANLSPKWKQIADKYASQIRAFEHLAFQISNTDEQYYTSLAINYKPADIPSNAENMFATLQQTLVDNPLSTQPFVVRSHTHQNFETLVQDKNQQLYLIGADGEVLWKDSLSAAIISDVHQVDYYNNGKLQYLFATPTALHIVDRTGSYVEGYPLKMPENVKIEWLSLIDYDNSKRYRFLVADTGGDLYMFDKTGTNLEGWTPLALEGRLSSPPFHLRVRGKDCIIAMEESGKVNVLTRRGGNYTGFPLVFDDKVHGPLFVKPGTNLENTELTTLTESGEITTFHLEGGVVSKEQLYRPSTEATFRLCIDELGKTYVIARQDFTKLSILNREGTLVFEKNYISQGALGSGLLGVQYYDFGAGNEIYAVTDKVQEFTYLYNAAGELYNNRPIESGFEIGLLYFEQDNKFRIYRNYENEFSVISLTKR